MGRPLVGETGVLIVQGLSSLSLLLLMRDVAPLRVDRGSSVDSSLSYEVLSRASCLRPSSFRELTMGYKNIVANITSELRL